MTRLTIVSLVLALSLLASNSATAKPEKLQVAKAEYYHADGYIKAIGKNARRTIYHPDPRVKHRWQRDLRYLIRVRHRAYLTLHPAPTVAEWLANDFSCIHRYEGSWTANTGNGYYGGLQMDLAFQGRYGADFVRRWGTADNWPSWAQMQAAVRAYQSGRGFNPWPNTARACGLL